MLAWDTSGQMVSAALGSGDWLSGGEGLPRWRCVDAPGGAQASATLLPTLQQLLQDHEVPLPVVEGNRIIGLVHQGDILRWLALHEPTSPLND